MYNISFPALYIGGAFHSQDYAIIKVFDSIFEENIAQEGGVISAAFTAANFSNCTFYSNKAVSGGGVMALELSNCTVLDSYFLSNKAGQGGVFYLESRSTLITRYSKFFNSSVIFILFFA